jgi:hypothetical protein
MEAFLGAPLGVFLGLTVVLMGGCAFLTGQSLAQTWKPEWQIYVYSLVLGLADRFLVYALFGGSLRSAGGYAVHTLAILALGVVAYRASRARRMVQQYPWLYARSGLFSWREKGGGHIG